MLKVKINKNNSVRVFKKMLEGKNTAFNKRANRNMLVSVSVEGYAYLFPSSITHDKHYIGWSGDYDISTPYPNYYENLPYTVLELIAEEYLKDDIKETSVYNTTNLIHGLDSIILKKEYLVFVEGRKAPSRIHSSLEEAEEEAQRLAKYLNNVGREIHVVESKSKFISKIEVKRVSAKPLSCPPTPSEVPYDVMGDFLGRVFN